MTTNQRDRSTPDSAGQQGTNPAARAQTSPTPNENDKTQERDRQGQSGVRKGEGREERQPDGGTSSQSGGSKATSGGEYPRATAHQEVEKPRSPQEDKENPDRARRDERGHTGPSQPAGGSKR